MLGVLTTILTVILVFICVLMSLVIMMQRPKQEGLGAAFGGGIADRMLGSGTTDFLQRSTVIMGVLFFVLSFTIATLMAYDRSAARASNVDSLKGRVQQEEGATPADSTPGVPAPAEGEGAGDPAPGIGNAPDAEDDPAPAEGEGDADADPAEEGDAAEPAGDEETAEEDATEETPES